MERVNIGLKAGTDNPGDTKRTQLIEAAIKTMNAYVDGKSGDLDNWAGFLRGTYVDDGKLVRQGYDA